MAADYDQLVQHLGALRQRLAQLENEDYMTAYYKGYSASGDDLATVEAQIEHLTQQIDAVQARLDAWQWD